jgi:hypothetical protein
MFEVPPTRRILRKKKQTKKRKQSSRQRINDPGTGRRIGDKRHILLSVAVRKWFARTSVKPAAPKRRRKT